MGKTDGRQTDLENDQISTTWTPKIELKNSKWRRRTSKKGPKKEPMSQQWRHLGDRRHLGNNRDHSLIPWRRQMEPESSQWLRRMSKKGPMSQQWRRLGNRRHLRRQKGPQRMPMEGSNKAQKTKSEPTWVQQGSKKVSKKDPNERP